MKGTERSPLLRLFKLHWSRHSRAILLGALAILSINSAELYLPVLLKDAVDSFQNTKLISVHQSRLLLGLAIVVVFQVFGRYLWRVALSKSSMLSAAEFRKLFSSQVFSLKIPAFEQRRVGDLMTLATSDIENMRFAIGPGFISIIDSVFYLITLPAIMFWMDPTLTWRILIPVSMIPFVVYFLQIKFYHQSKQVQQQIGILGTLTQELVSGARLIKNFSLEGIIQNKIRRESHELNRRQVSLAQGTALLNPAMEFFLSTSIVVLFSSAGDSIGTLVAMQRYLQKLLWPLLASSMAVIYFQKARASGHDFFSFIDDENREPEASALPESNRPFDPQAPLIEGVGLTFAYSEGRPVIEGLDFKIFPGEWIGINGSVGSGKSTLFQLLLGFYPLGKNQLFLSGKDILEIDPHLLRSHFSAVFQDPYIFQGTLQENLMVSEEMHPLSWCMDVSGMKPEEFSHRMTQKIGERGAGLSGGQKQRLGIARAIRKKSPILLLDDPLSSVDQSTAIKVIHELQREIRPLGTTVLFASHHEEHLAFCDRIIRL